MSDILETLQLDEIDTLKLNNAALRRNAAQVELRLCQNALDALVQGVTQKYGLSSVDNVNLDTGAITRAPKPDITPPVEKKFSKLLEEKLAKKKRIKDAQQHIFDAFKRPEEQK